MDPETADRLRRSPAPVDPRRADRRAHERSISAIGLVSCAAGQAYDAQDLGCSRTSAHAPKPRSTTRGSTRRVGVALTLRRRSLLPPGLPVLRDLGLAARYLWRRHTEASGDWYEAVALSGERVFLAVGDVVGQGTEAAVMGQLRSAMRASTRSQGCRRRPLEKLSDFAAGVPGAEVSTAAAAGVDGAWARDLRLRRPAAAHRGRRRAAPSSRTGAARPSRSALTAIGEAAGQFDEGSSLVLYTDELRRAAARAARCRPGAAGGRGGGGGGRPPGRSASCSSTRWWTGARSSTTSRCWSPGGRRQSALALTVIAEPRALER